MMWHRCTNLVAAILALTLVSPLLAGCEGNRVYSSARIGVRLSDDGGVEVVSDACGKAAPSKMEITDQDGLKQLWSATSSSAFDGLVVVRADGGTAQGWATVGSVDVKIGAAVGRPGLFGRPGGLAVHVFRPQEPSARRIGGCLLFIRWGRTM